MIYVKFDVAVLVIFYFDHELKTNQSRVINS